MQRSKGNLSYLVKVPSAEQNCKTVSFAIIHKKLLRKYRSNFVQKMDKSIKAVALKRPSINDGNTSSALNIRGASKPKSV